MHNSFTNPQMAPAACPIAPDVAAIIKASTSLRTALKKLRRDLVYCQQCPNSHLCKNYTTYQETVHRAINAVAQEWTQSQ